MTDTTHARKASRTAASAAEPAAETLRAELPSSFIDLFDKTLARTKDELCRILGDEIDQAA